MSIAGLFINHDSERQERNAVFALIGMPKAVESTSISTEEAAGPDLIATLYQQYRRVLDDPQLSLAASWATYVKPVADPASSGQDKTSPVASACLSIEALLSGAQHLEDAFGPLQKGATPDVAHAAPVPEILRLFAPAEYQTTTARRPAPHPPALTRREHHAPGIDSPLSAPRTSIGGTQ